MALSLTISQARGGGDRQTRLIARGTMSIGRASGNDWVLADPDQHLSRTHCQISFENGRYFITDRSTNGMLINGATTPTTRDMRLQLNDGDSILFGSYKMVATEIEEQEASASSPFGASSFAGRRTDPFAAAGGHEGGNPLDIDPFEDRLGASDGFSHPMPHAPSPSLRMSDPFDALDKNKSADPEEDLYRGRNQADAWAGPSQRDQSGVMSNAFAAPRALTPPPADLNDMDFNALLGDMMPGAPSAAPAPRAPAPPGPPPMSLSGDPFADLLGDAPLGTAPAPIPPPPPPMPVMAPPAAPVAQTAAAAPPPAPPVPVMTPQPVPAPVAATGPGAAALLQAFLDGAGLPKGDFGAVDPEVTMRALGALFRAFVSGTRDVLISRAEIKHEMRVEQTMIRSRDNNALKFSISQDEALLALLRPDRPGYKAPLASVEEAFDDIRSHEMALMAGMQTGMMALLKRFDPAALEERLQPGRLDSILPAARKARFWELFCVTYLDIAREAQDDFQAVFGRDFAKAYNEQIRKL